jgi:O-antigen/teichoic acid export membrane protein
MLTRGDATEPQVGDVQEKVARRLATRYRGEVFGRRAKADAVSVGARPSPPPRRPTSLESGQLFPYHLAPVVLDPSSGDGAQVERALQSGGLSHRAARNTIALIGGRVAGIGLTGIASVLLTRSLGASGYGQYASIQAYIFLFAWAASFGLEAILPRELARRPQLARTLVQSGALISAGFSALAMGVALIAATKFGYSGLLLLVVLMAVDIIGLTPLRIPGAIYQADLRQWLSVTATMTRQVVWVVVLAVIWITGASLLAVVVGRLIASVVEVAIILLGLGGKLRRPADSVVRPKGLVRELLAATLPLALTALAAAVFRRVDQVILHRLVDATAVGRYAAAANLVELFNILPTAVMTSLFPLLVKSHESPKEFNRYVVEASRYLLVCAFGACLVISLFGTQIMTLLFGAGFSGAGSLAGILIWAEVASFFGVVMTNVVLAKGLQRFLPVATVAGAVLNLGLNLVLIPRSGAVGAAYATVISYSAVSIILSLGPRETRPLVLLVGKGAVPPAVLSVAAILFANLVVAPASPALRLALGSAIFLAGLVVTKTLRRGDVQTLRSMIFPRKPRR